MRDLFTTEGALFIEPGQTLSGISRHPRVLRVTSGRVWITLEGFAHDYFLQAGDSFTVEPGRLTVIEADREAAGVQSHSPYRSGALGRLILQLRAAAGRRLNRRTARTALAAHRPCNDACC